MNKKRLSWLILAYVFLLSIPIVAHQDKKPLTNEDVIKMVKAGLSESTIVLVIQKSPNKFDTSPDALIALKEAGATPKVLEVILENKNESTPPNKKEQGGITLGDLIEQVKPSTKPETPDSSSELIIGTYKAWATETTNSVSFSGLKDERIIRIKIDSIDKDGNVKAELFGIDGRLKGRIDTEGKLQLEGYIITISGEWKFTLTAIVEDKALTNGKYVQSSRNVETKGVFKVAVLEAGN